MRNPVNVDVYNYEVIATLEMYDMTLTTDDKEHKIKMTIEKAKELRDKLTEALREAGHE